VKEEQISGLVEAKRNVNVAIVGEEIQIAQEHFHIVVDRLDVRWETRIVPWILDAHYRQENLRTDVYLLDLRRLWIVVTAQNWTRIETAFD
jgi:hypothetical protein